VGVARSALVLAGWLALSFGAGAFGSRFPPGEWYLRLDKPPWTPPGWVFGPVWILLYALMGTAAWMVWRERGWSGGALPLALFTAQLVLNALWPWLFFGLHRPGLALADLALLLGVLLPTALAFRRARPAAGALLVPYLLWASFALALNASIWLRNRGA
jgi:translocator protein